MNFWDEKEAKQFFQRLPFYDMFVEKPRIKRIRNINLLHKLPFYDELNILKISKAVKRYARSYKTEILHLKVPLVQLESSKSCIKYLFKDLLDEIKGFKCQITVKVLLRKHKKNGGIEFAPVYFNSTTKTVIGPEDSLAKSF